MDRYGSVKGRNPITAATIVSKALFKIPDILTQRRNPATLDTVGDVGQFFPAQQGFSHRNKNLLIGQSYSSHRVLNLQIKRRRLSPSPWLWEECIITLSPLKVKAKISLLGSSARIIPTLHQLHQFHMAANHRIR